MRSALRSVAIGFGWTIAVIVLLAVVLYSFGGPMRPSGEARDAYAVLVAEGLAEPVDARLVVPIPGCTCHSDDPAAVVPHAEYRLRDCSRCH